MTVLIRFDGLSREASIEAAFRTHVQGQGPAMTLDEFRARLERQGRVTFGPEDYPLQADKRDGEFEIVFELREESCRENGSVRNAGSHSVDASSGKRRASGSAPVSTEDVESTRAPSRLPAKAAAKRSTYILTIDELPPSLNTIIRAHWAEKNRMKRRYTALVMEAAQRDEIPQATGKRRVKMTFYWPDRRRRDPDNYFKVAADSLTHAGMILDDNPGVIELNMSEFVVDRENPRLEIELEDLE